MGYKCNVKLWTVSNRCQYDDVGYDSQAPSQSLAIQRAHGFYWDYHHTVNTLTKQECTLPSIRDHYYTTCTLFVSKQPYSQVTGDRELWQTLTLKSI